MQKIKIIICDDMKAIRDRIKISINSQSDMEVVGVASSAKEVMQLVDTVSCDVLLIDIQMEYETAGIDAIESINSQHPEVKIIVLTVHDNDDLVVDAYINGALDYLVKESNDEFILQIIRKVYNNENHIGKRISKTLRGNAIKEKKTKQSFLFFIHGYSTLTVAERNILKLIYNGYSRRKIATEEHLSDNTVSSHIGHILKKLDYSNTKDLVIFIRTINFFEELDI